MRKMVVVGDPPAPGGAVLPYSSRKYALHGHQVALIGGRAYCEGCNSVGIIAKAGGPGRMKFISEVALEGDVVICHCPVPPPLIATLVHTSWYDDMGGGIGSLEPHLLVPGWLSADRSTVAASKRLVDYAVRKFTWPCRGSLQTRHQNAHHRHCCRVLHHSPHRLYDRLPSGNAHSRGDALRRHLFFERHGLSHARQSRLGLTTYRSTQQCGQHHRVRSLCALGRLHLRSHWY